MPTAGVKELRRGAPSFPQPPSGLSGPSGSPGPSGLARPVWQARPGSPGSSGPSGSSGPLWLAARPARSARPSAWSVLAARLAATSGAATCPAGVSSSRRVSPAGASSPATRPDGRLPAGVRLRPGPRWTGVRPARATPGRERRPAHQPAARPSPLLAEPAAPRGLAVIARSRAAMPTTARRRREVGVLTPPGDPAPGGPPLATGPQPVSPPAAQRTPARVPAPQVRPGHGLDGPEITSSWPAQPEIEETESLRGVLG